MKPLMFCVLCLLVSVSAYAGTSSPDSSRVFTARIIVVLDGDTVMIRRDKGLLKIRLAEIDAPEKAQDFGEASRRSLAEMVLQKQVRVASRAMDKYGRMVATLGIDGLDVNAEQVRRGMAWDYSFHHSNRLLLAFQDEARRARRGLWQSAQAVPPWQWRKQHPFPGSHAVQTDNVSRSGSNSICSKKYCSEMRSCEEALHYLSQCGKRQLDANHDGVPCESLCVRRGK